MNRIFILTCLLTVAVAATALSATGFYDLTATISPGNKLDISGKMPQANQEVTIKITDPLGCLDYLDQTTSGVGGAFSFSYTMISPTTGVYQVALNGQNMLKPYVLMYYYDETLAPLRIGDVNGDGYVNAADIVPINRHALGIELITAAKTLAAADVNGDGFVNAADIVPINRHSLGIELMDLQ